MPQTNSSACNILDKIVWDLKGMPLIDYLGEGQTINWTYYAAPPNKVNLVINEKRPASTQKRVLLYRDNTASHTSSILREN